MTIWDSHSYNLGRLLIANYGGLFGNTAWNTDRQIVFPWGFDAVHLPFVRLGWGYALPSFSCLIGLLLIVFYMVKAHVDERTAWCCSLALLALPTVVFQAASTKNDVGMVFGVACWAYALWRFDQEKLRRFLFLGALGLSFAAGAKSSGVPLFVLLSVYTVWRLRSDKGLIATFIGFTLLNFVLLGSVETYVNTWKTFGNFIGPPFIVDHRNRDGFDGMVANFVRYLIGSTDIGLDLANIHSPFAVKLQELCRATLKLMLLENKGYRADYSDSALVFYRAGGEAGSAFGPLGTMSLWAAVWILFTRPVRDVLWRLCAAGFAALLLTCATIGWMPWNMRFLILPFVLFTLATTILLTGPDARSVLGRRIFLFLALCSAIFFPIYSFNKSPHDLWQSVTNRDWVMTKERPSMLEVVSDLETRRGQIGHTPLLLYAGGDSWVFPILQMRALNVIPAPHIDRKRLQQAAAQYASDSVYVLVLNQQLTPGLEVTLIRTFQEPDTSLFLWHAAPGTAPLSE